MLSQILPKFTASKSKSIVFNQDDIMLGTNALTARLDFDTLEQNFSYLIHQQRTEYEPNEVLDAGVDLQFAQHVDRNRRIKRRREQQEAYPSIEHAELRPNESSIPKNTKTAQEQPIALYLSTHRSLPSAEAPSKASARGGQAAAFADALANRELRLREFIEWWLVQEALAQETESIRFDRNLSVLSDTVVQFLNGCTNLRATREPKLSLLVDKGGKTLDLRQLSDGERSMIALVLDLARRLALANPKLADPTSEGRAIVLIDEIDLHLHPRWQREVVHKLTRTFPNCQFIATTHSPQIIGEVPPKNITIIQDGMTVRPDRSFGMNSNWVLEYLMDTTERDEAIAVRLDKISDLIEDEEFKQATAEIDRLRIEIGDFPELVRLQTKLDRMQLIGI